ncbi:MAG TPA: tRNA uridine-5-carboxymethylaminomethyl(34) synthesis GTPase MnmE [Gammaproteobacteria bacterium]|nr:tRNA uridine-5-carboxymethylaminomethyl(34) synthesis GTPase MnmE [Gammaproteobacteria bacterium]
MHKNPETIAAIATPPGRGGVGIIRVSGPKAADIALKVGGETPEPRRIAVRGFKDADGSLIDSGLLLYFAAPNSFTGEDVLELHGHGGRVVLDLLLQRVIALGARLAKPGEFSERAFLNDKLDLAQAEAVADLIDSGTAQAARAAVRSLSGDFSAQVQLLVEALTTLRAYVEAAIDFPDEEVDFLTEGDVTGRLEEIRGRFERLSQAARQGSLLRDGMTAVIAGQPNVGKSSLLNYLAGHEAAIVTDIPGTTRDLLREHVSLDGLPLHLVDTAGLRESDDPVEQEGVRRAKREMQNADRVLLLVDATRGLGAEDERTLEALPLELAVTVVYNKIDLTGQDPAEDELDGLPSLWLSARTGQGMELLREHLKQAAGFEEQEGGFSARRRHLDALARARQHLNAAMDQAKAGAGELLAEDLRLAQTALSEITGEFTSDDLLGKIFSSFCIGK